MNDDENKDWHDWDTISVDEALQILNEEEAQEEDKEEYGLLKGSDYDENEADEEELKMIKEAKEEAKSKEDDDSIYLECRELSSGAAENFTLIPDDYVEILMQ